MGFGDIRYDPVRWRRLADGEDDGRILVGGDKCYDVAGRWCSGIVHGLAWVGRIAEYGQHKACVRRRVVGWVAVEGDCCGMDNDECDAVLPILE